MEQQISNTENVITRSETLRLPRYLTNESCNKILVYALVTSRLDYGNSFKQRLQRVHIVCRLPNYSHEEIHLFKHFNVLSFENLIFYTYAFIYLA